MTKKVAIQGFSGSFHEQAVNLFYGSDAAGKVQIVECDTFEQEYRCLENGTADAMAIAIENTVSGGLIPNFELLRKYGRKIKGEVFLRIVQNLMALPGQSIEDIKEVRTHYMAINQTRPWFNDKPWIRLVESEDTAKSAKEIREKGLVGIGAVASTLAAQEYDLQILGSSIETYKQNYTRFLIIDDSLPEAPDADKASLCFTLPHKTGALAQVLTILSFYDMNLTRIQSLPIPGREWQYFFYADIKFADRVRFEQALAAARPLMEDLQILGIYKSSI